MKAEGKNFFGEPALATSIGESATWIGKAVFLDSAGDMPELAAAVSSGSITLLAIDGSAGSFDANDGSTGATKRLTSTTAMRIAASEVAPQAHCFIRRRRRPVGSSKIKKVPLWSAQTFIILRSSRYAI